MTDRSDNSTHTSVIKTAIRKAFLWHIIRDMTTITKLFSSLAVLVFVSGSAVNSHAQKGVDTQTQKIKDESNRVTSRTSDATRSWSWGKGKTKTREMLANPYKLNARRDVLLESIQSVLRDQRIVIDEQNSRLANGIIVTQPIVFAKGGLAQGSLARVAQIDQQYDTYTQARFSFTIEVQSIDGIQNNIAVNAKIEGRSGAIVPEWIAVPSLGILEDEFLAKLVESVTGTSPDPVQDTTNN